MKFRKNIKLVHLVTLLFLAKSNDSRALLGLGAYGGAKLNSGINTKDLGSDSSISFGLLGGIRAFGARLDLEYTFVGKAVNPNKVDLQTILDKSVSINNLSLNLNYNLFELPIVSLLKIYVGGGIGKTYFTKYLFSSTVNESFSWSVGCGATFSLINILNLDVGYKYVDFGKLNVSDSSSSDIKNNLIYIALRIGF